MTEERDIEQAQPAKPTYHRGGYIPAPVDGDDIVLVKLSRRCAVLDFDPAHPMRALNAALADTETDWIVPRALIDACGPELVAGLAQYAREDSSGKPWGPDGTMAYNPGPEAQP